MDQNIENKCSKSEDLIHLQRLIFKIHGPNINFRGSYPFEQWSWEEKMENSAKNADN